MVFESVEVLRKEGFTGFKSIVDLFHVCSSVPKERGIYIVLYLCRSRPEFTEKGVGGLFKRKDPNVSLELLQSAWLDNSIVVYIGQSGGICKGRWSNNTLYKRIRLYMRFRQDKPSAHYGGRYIWQIKNSKNLIVCWKPLPGKIADPRQVETQLLLEFISC